MTSVTTIPKHDIADASLAAEGRKNPIFMGGLGMINNTVLHKHRNVIRFSDYGSGSNVLAARALFMGRQAAVVAYGTATVVAGLATWWAAPWSTATATGP